MKPAGIFATIHNVIFAEQWLLFSSILSTFKARFLPVNYTCERGFVLQSNEKIDYLICIEVYLFKCV